MTKRTKIICEQLGTLIERVEKLEKRYIKQDITCLKARLSEYVEEPKPQTQTIYAGTEDNVEFFKTILATLGLDIKYQVEVVDGEYEVNILK